MKNTGLINVAAKIRGKQNIEQKNAELVSKRKMKNNEY
jgi:hypothetical protein